MKTLTLIRNSQLLEVIVVSAVRWLRCCHPAHISLWPLGSGYGEGEGHALEEGRGPACEVSLPSRTVLLYCSPSA